MLRYPYVSGSNPDLELGDPSNKDTALRWGIEDREKKNHNMGPNIYIVDVQPLVTTL